MFILNIIWSLLKLLFKNIHIFVDCSLYKSINHASSIGLPILTKIPAC